MAQETVTETPVEETIVDLSAEKDGRRAVLYDQDGRQFGQQDLIHPDDLDSAMLDLDGVDIKAIPTVAQRVQEAKMPVQVSADQIAGHDCLWAGWRPQNAVLPGDGTVTEGFFAVGKDLETGRAFSIFVGGIALCRTLRNVKAPMVARIEKKGRTLIFA